jgi:hypothetical protein
MKMINRIGLLLVSLALMVGCIDDGNVTNKRVVPAHAETRFLFTGKTMIPICIYVPTKYLLTFSKNGESETVYLDKSEWDEYNVGDRYLHAEEVQQ